MQFTARLVTYQQHRPCFLILRYTSVGSAVNQLCSVTSAIFCWRNRQNIPFNLPDIWWMKRVDLKCPAGGTWIWQMTMQYFDVKINSGNIFSHGPMISILTDWTLILAKCCRGNESWERILFLLRLKKNGGEKKKNDHRPCPRKERADGRNWLDVNPVDRSCSSSSVSEGNTFSSNYWFLCSSPSTCTDPCGHLCVAAAQKKTSHETNLYLRYPSLATAQKEGDAMCRCEGFIQPKTHGKSDTQEIRVRRSWSNVNSISWKILAKVLT